MNYQASLLVNTSFTSRQQQYHQKLVKEIPQGNDRERQRDERETETETETQTQTQRERERSKSMKRCIDETIL